MKLISLLVFSCLAFAAACSTETSSDCVGDHCICPATDSCAHDCSAGGNDCHIQGGSGPVDVLCGDGEECHVECMSAAGCNVDCSGSTECVVSCPATGCTVTDCVGEACVVSCGLGRAATRNGSTATCP